LILRTSGSDRLTIDGTTGAATFSSSVTANRFNVTGVGNPVAFDTTGVTGSVRLSTKNDFEFSIYNERGTTSEVIVGNSNIDLRTDNQVRLRVTPTGNVGIGTSVFPFSPRLSVNSTGQNTIAIQTTDTAQGSTGTIMYMGTGATTGNYTYGVIRVLGDGGTSAANLVLQPSGGIVAIGATSTNGRLGVRGTTNDSSAYAFEAANSSGNSLFLVRNDGNVGIGAVPSYQLQLSTDSAAKPSTNTWTIASDERVKENVNSYTKGLDVIMGINPVTYDYNGKAGFSKIKDNVGVIAQEIKDLMPESISTYKAKLNEEDEEETELFNFNSHALTYVLINSIKELKAEIEALKSQING
jgi:hypothetical protein